MYSEGMSAVAEGDIRPARIVKRGTAANSVLEADAGDEPIGISYNQTRSLNLEGYGATTLAAIAGDHLSIYGDGARMVPLTAGGAVSVGSWIKSDANGQGVASTTDREKVIGRARTAAAAAGELFMVDIMIRERSAA